MHFWTDLAQLQTHWKQFGGAFSSSSMANTVMENVTISTSFICKGRFCNILHTVPIEARERQGCNRTTSRDISFFLSFEIEVKDNFLIYTLLQSCEYAKQTLRTAAQDRLTFF